MKVSLCLITKNEEKNLERCVSSFRDDVDEVVVVDTGSTDNTVEIARKLGAIVKVVKWENDFSKARNETLDLATGDWIISADADEFLDMKDRGTIRSWLNGDCLSVNVVSNTETDRQINKQVRIFRKDPHYRWTSPIHEQISTSISNNGGVMRVSSISFLHDGYFGNRVDKYERNLAILLATESLSPVNVFYIGSTLWALQRREEAVDYLERAISSDGLTAEMVGMAYVKIAEYHIGKLDYKKAEEVCRAAIARLPMYTEVWYSFGQALYFQGKIEEAVGAFAHCAELGEPAQAHRSGVGTWMAFLALAQIRVETKNPDKALAFASLAFPYREAKTEAVKIIIGLNPTTEMIKKYLSGERLLELLILMGRYQDVISIADRNKKEEHAMLGIALAFSGKADQSMEYLDGDDIMSESIRAILSGDPTPRIGWERSVEIAYNMDKWDYIYEIGKTLEEGVLDLKLGKLLYKKDPDKAISFLERAQKAGKVDGTALWMMAMWCIGKDNITAANLMIESLKKEDDVKRYGDAILFIYKIGRVKEAMVLNDLAIKKFPNMFVFRKNKNTIFSEQHRSA